MKYTPGIATIIALIVAATAWAQPIDVRDAGVHHLRAPDRIPPAVSYEFAEPELRLVDGGLEIVETMLFSVERWAGEAEIELPQFPDWSPFEPLRLELFTSIRGGIQVNYENRYLDEPAWPYAYAYGFGTIAPDATGEPLFFAYGDHYTEGGWTVAEPVMPGGRDVICWGFSSIWDWPPEPLFPMAQAIKSTTPVYETISGDLDWIVGDAAWRLTLDVEAWTAIGGVPGRYVCTNGGAEWGGALELTYQYVDPLAPGPSPPPGTAP